MELIRWPVGANFTKSNAPAELIRCPIETNIWWNFTKRNTPTELIR